MSKIIIFHNIGLGDKPENKFQFDHNTLWL